ncbi:hypothetical protein CPC08DRAFT_753896 [Agrocybe pediades]|nr:hypothetical protein CPC08DRAFT_753896 [Agrocybe pediades]
MPSSTEHEDDRRSSSPEITLSLTTSPAKLIKYARNLEIDRTTAQAEILNLRRKLADIARNDANGSDDDETEEPTRKKSRTHSHAQADKAYEEKARQAGHLFVINKGLFLQAGVETFGTALDPEFDEAQRFENADNKIQGQLREIMKVLGPQLSDEITDAWLPASFIAGMRAQRSNTATRLRHHCATIFGVSEEDMLTSATRKEKFRKLIGWVENSNGVGSYSSVDVEILHKDYGGHYDIKKAFLNPVLMRVFTALIRGPKAAKEMMRSDMSISLNPKNDTMERKHHIRNITPGAIAGAAILTRWALSADEMLQDVGHITGINYSRDFDEYLELFLSGLHKKKKSIINVIREWDRVIFPHSESSLVASDTDVHTSGFKAAMRMLDEDEVEEDVGGEE